MSVWLEEQLLPNLRWSFQINAILQSCQTKFQKVQLVDTEPFGKTLLLDGLMQSCDLDENIYHECLVHPALLSHPNPKTVLVGGGGEGSTIREVLKHKSVEKCIMVDIDELVVEFCKKHLEKNKKAFEDPRFELVIEDCEKYLKEYQGTFDVIILDLDDPVEGGPCYKLYTKTFYDMAKTKLSPNGILITQSGGAGPILSQAVFSPINNTLRQVFSKVRPYIQAVFSFAEEWAWNLCLNDETADIFSAKSEEEFNQLVSSRLTEELTFLDWESYRRLWLLPKPLRTLFQNETKIISESQLAFFPGNKGQIE
jgi:thermospermine synthase